MIVCELPAVMIAAATVAAVRLAPASASFQSNFSRASGEGCKAELRSATSKNKSRRMLDSIQALLLRLKAFQSLPGGAGITQRPLVYRGVECPS